MKISLCIICKNEEKKIARCINSVKSKVDEIVVVDTGSTDKTIDIVKGLGAKVYEIQWENDFAKARNYAIEKCKGNWIIFLDADEYLSEKSLPELRNQILIAENMKKEAIIVEMLNEENEKVKSIFKLIRIFKNKKDIRYIGKIHERVVNVGGDIQMLDLSKDIIVRHDGYDEQTLNEKNKIERNLSMLLKEYEANPKNSDICYYLMETYAGQDDIENAWMYGHKVLEYNNAQLEGVNVTTYNRLLEIACKKDKPEEVIVKLYNEAVKYDEVHPDFDFRYAAYLYGKNETDLAIEHIKICLNKMEKYKGYTVSFIMGEPIEIFKLLAQCYINQNRIQEAIPVLVKILRVNLYEYSVLYALLNILSEVETNEAIIGFLSKLYDFNNKKDQMVLAKISSQLSNKSLFNDIKCIISEDVRAHLNIE